MTAWLTGGGPSSANVNVRNDEPRAVNPGFVTDSEWLPRGDHRQNLGDEVRGGCSTQAARAVGPDDGADPGRASGEGRTMAQATGRGRLPDEGGAGAGRGGQPGGGDAGATMSRQNRRPRGLKGAGSQQRQLCTDGDRQRCISIESIEYLECELAKSLGEGNRNGVPDLFEDVTLGSTADELPIVRKRL